MGITGLKRIAEECGLSCRENEPMRLHTTFCIGGPADLYIEVTDIDVLPRLLSAAKERCVPVTVIGKGSNLLVSDDGISGAVLRICDTKTKVCGETLICHAGAKLSQVCLLAKEHSLEGMEFAWGIPGTVGGAVYMNAGAYGGEMKQALSSVRSVDMDGRTVTRTAEELQLGYRTSIFKTCGEIILSAELKLTKGEREAIRAKMDDFLSRRKEKQPLEFPSAGSTFKRPQGYFAGTLIEQSGLKGKSVGGAAVSEKHAGFIINTGAATCADVRRLIELIKHEVYQKFGVELEPEVIFCGR